MSNNYTLETKLTELPLAKFSKVSLIAVITQALKKASKDLTILDLSRFSVIDNQLYFKQGYAEKMPNIGKVRSNEIAPFIILSKALKKKKESEVQR